MKQNLTHLIKTRRFIIPAELIPRLRELQAQSRQYLFNQIAEAEDAVVMTAGMGAAMYLTLNGRVIIDEDDLWLEKPMPPREAADEKEMFTAVIIGAKKRNSPELLTLLPERPSDAADCPDCSGTGWKRYAQNLEFICPACGGVGWIAGS